jgi:hypothetical protein
VLVEALVEAQAEVLAGAAELLAEVLVVEHPAEALVAELHPEFVRIVGIPCNSRHQTLPARQLPSPMHSRLSNRHIPLPMRSLTHKRHRQEQAPNQGNTTIRSEKARRSVMQQNSLRPEEQKVINTSEQLARLLANSADWAGSYLKDAQIRKFMQKVIQEKQITVKRIGESARRPLALGVFGASQCGKSYLVSELVRGARPTPMVLLNQARQVAQSRDYLEEINPAGGRESTAIVTRFTTRPYRQVAGCSAYIRLLSITDLVKIFLNGFLFECQSDFMPSADELQKVRYSFRSFAGKASASSLLSEADVWDLQDYARRHFHNQFLRMLEDINYWGIMQEEIRTLPADQQITYLEWLWGRFPKITELFRHLVKELGAMGGEVVGIFDEALLPRENSIIDVQRLSQLLKIGNRKCSVVLGNGSEVALDSSVLCALTSELIMQVQDPGEEALVQKLDILDFPGARARAQVFDQNRLSKDHEALIEVFLRGLIWSTNG